MAKPPIVLNQEETERLLNAIRYPKGPRSQTAASFRNFLCCLFMLDAGLRVSEAIQLKQFMVCSNGVIISALSVPAEIAKLHQSRIIPLTQRLKEELEFCREYLWINCEENSLHYLFHTGNPRKHITDRRIRQVVQTAGQATLGRKVWPHVLRHTFATNLMRVTSTRVVQELLGHKNLTSTQIYTHPNSQDLLKAITAVEKT